MLFEATTVVVAEAVRDVMHDSLDQIRKNNTRIVMLENAISAEELAFCLGKEPSSLQRLLDQDHAKFSASLARLVEQTFSKPKFWLDHGDSSNESNSKNFDLFG